MIYTPLTKKAMSYAFEAHKNQVDAGGAPYIFHPFYVADRMDDELTTAAALLHDVAEDCGITADDLQKAGFPPVVTEAVEVLTRRRGEDYFEYIKRVEENPVAVKVKRVDLQHNSMLERFDRIGEAEKARGEKYKRALDQLSGKS